MSTNIIDSGCDLLPSLCRHTSITTRSAPHNTTRAHSILVSRYLIMPSQMKQTAATLPLNIFTSYPLLYGILVVPWRTGRKVLEVIRPTTRLYAYTEVHSALNKPCVSSRGSLVVQDTPVGQFRQHPTPSIHPPPPGGRDSARGDSAIGFPRSSSRSRIKGCPIILYDSTYRPSISSFPFCRRLGILTSPLPQSWRSSRSKLLLVVKASKDQTTDTLSVFSATNVESSRTTH